MTKTKKSDFEHEDNEKIARLISYIPATLHVQNLINLKTPYGVQISQNSEVYNNALEIAADHFYDSAIDGKTPCFPFVIEE